MKIIFLDAKTIGEDMDLSGYETLGEVVKYDFSTPHPGPAWGQTQSCEGQV